ncbi:hypothetical protein [Leucobacter massiliensis]|uniref:Uncharacterized protein n=1 Tax=Leucobacter massiliensis TaxID=1686285 RepID=A0A2S9QLQ2_9MICO|nr:hypothetical protein [Leucobacter massiliensis]PRI10518.1 hypothetical protein B4915_10960 [Leucobacter massiliensis]
MNYGLRRTLRFSEDEEAAVAAMRAALGKIHGVEAEQVPFSKALRLLLTENHRAAQVLAGQPEAWAASGTFELPDEVWNGLTECRNRLSHSQGSLYVILRKLNFDEGVTREEVRDAFTAVQESKATVDRMEALLLDFISAASAGAVAKDGQEAA